MTTIQKFELYDNLAALPKDANLKISCTTINELPIEHSTIIYVFILHHFIIDKKIDINVFITNIQKSKNINQPYNVKNFSSKGATFVLSNLPIDLQNIIHHYLLSIKE